MKFKDFFVIQILREINFGESRRSKADFLAIWGSLNFDNMVNFSLVEKQKFTEIKIQSLKMCENGRFCTSSIPYIDFT